jgi:hypothetical protein
MVDFWLVQKEWNIWLFFIKQDSLFKDKKHNKLDQFVARSVFKTTHTPGDLTMVDFWQAQ